MFAIISNNAIAMLVAPGTPFEWNGIQFPQNWCNLSSPQEKAAISMVDVVYGQRPDDKYYWVSEDAPVYANGVVTVNYTATPKDLLTLQNSAVTDVQQQAYSILLPSDWMAIKALETGGVVAENWKTWRAGIRVQAQHQVALITACTTVDELAALAPVQWAHDPNYIAEA